MVSPNDRISEDKCENAKRKSKEAFFRNVYETSIIRFDEDNAPSRRGSTAKRATRARASLKEDSDGDLQLESSSCLLSAVASTEELDSEAPLPRPGLFVERHATRFSKASKITLYPGTNTRTDVSLTLARLRGSEPLKPAAPEKHEKPRTGCEGFCIPGYCKGNTCKHPPNNEPLLKGVMNCMSFCLTPHYYNSLSDRRTESGLTIDDVIQYGVDQYKWNYALNKYYAPGVFFPVNVGVVAKDADCYFVFSELFDAVIAARHNGYPVEALHPRDCNPKHVRPESVLLSAKGNDKIVRWCGVMASRNIEGFPFVPMQSRSSRADLNMLISGVLDELPPESRGKYFDLDEVLPVHQEHRLQQQTQVQQQQQQQFPQYENEYALDSHPSQMHPDLPQMRFLKPLRPNPLKETHLVKDFPDGRDVWAIDEGRFYIIRNVRDHLTFVATQEGSNIREMFIKWLRWMKRIEADLTKSKLPFAFDDRLGYMGPNPANLGTAMTLAVRMSLPALHRFPLFDEILVHLRLRRGTALDFEPDAIPKETLQHALSSIGPAPELSSLPDPCSFTIYNEDRLGLTEVESFEQFIVSINRLVEAEKRLAKADIVNQDEFPRQIFIDYRLAQRKESLEPKSSADLGGNKENPTFSFTSDFPNVKENQTVVAQVLRENEFQFKDWLQMKSEKGFSFSEAIQIGVDHPQGRFSHRNEIARVGMVVGDENCYQAFEPFFDELTPLLHSDYNKDGCHLTLSDLTGIEVDDLIDHRFITEIRIETRRNVSGFKMPTTISREDRRLLERIAVHCLGYLEHQKIEFEVKGKYHQYGHLEHLKQNIDDNGIKCLYFPLEDRVLHKKAGLLRDWPDARGYWCNTDRTVMCNINEVDHLMFTSTEKSSKLRSVFQRHQLVLEVFELRLKEFAEKHFAHDKHLGFLTTCPGDLGTGTTMFVNMRLQNLVKNERMFLRVVRKHRMRHQRVDHDIWSLYNVDTLGYPECDVLGLMYEGCKKIMELDIFLGSLESTEWIENETKLPLRKIAHLIHCDMSWYAPLFFEPDEDEENRNQFI